MTALTQERLREMFSYDPETGVFTRIKGGRGLPLPGSTFGCKNGRGYVIGMVDGRIYLLHRLAWFYMHGFWVDFIDHANGDKADNRISNLRSATLSQNNANVRLKITNTSGFKGASWQPHAKAFRASIKTAGRSIHLGYADTAQEAHDMYRAAADKHFGDFARAS